MKVQKTRFILALLVIVLIAGQVDAQMAGNPIGLRGQGQWTISATGTYMRQHVGGGTAVSKRMFLKSNWGLTSWFDVYGILGGVQLAVESNKINIIDYHGETQFGFGAGFNISHPISSSGIRVWSGGQVLRFTSQGSFYEDMGIIRKEYAMAYDWREFHVYAGIICPIQSVQFYIAGVGWALQRLDTKNEYAEFEDTRTYLGEEEGEYRSGLWTGAIIGVEFFLPRQYTIGVECILFNEENYQVMIGISQTGFDVW